MVEQPRTEVIVSPSDHFACDPRDEARLMAIVQRIAAHAQLPALPACRISIASRPAAHCGLGSGTQLALSVAEAVCCFIGQSLQPDVLATQIAMRGQRSAVGVHGYTCGGLVFEDGQPNRDLNPIVDRVELPAGWTVTILRSSRPVRSVCGQFESHQFTSLRPAGSLVREALRQRITAEILPAARRGDFAAFADAVQQYNRASGELFEPVQGGAYNGRAVSELIDWLVHRGASGVGQSSWGPAVFAWFESRAYADSLLQQLPPEVERVAVTRPRNRPRTLRCD
jgi:beta-RFAP synthase